jgi:hypothetical protein
MVLLDELLSPLIKRRHNAYGIADVTDEEALAALGERQYDAVVCTMALMDMPVILWQIPPVLAGRLRRQKA